MSEPFFTATIANETNDTPNFLHKDEQIIKAYATSVRDRFYVTSYRLVTVDSQGLTGKRQTRMSIPFAEIFGWKIETAGTIDLDAELTIYTRLGDIQLKLYKNVDYHSLERLLVACIN